MARSKNHPVPRVRHSTSALRGLRITFSGLLCVGIVIMVGLAALNSEANLLFLLFGISVGVVLASAVWPVFMVRRLDIERGVPAAVAAGRHFEMEYVVHSRRRWFRSWSLTIGELPSGRPPVRLPLAYVETLKPGDTHHARVSAMCPMRGRYALRGVRILSRFPFGLFACSVDYRLPAEFIVYPAMGRFRRSPWRERRHSDSLSQGNTRRRGGEQEEFYGVREYRQGDNPRWIHWRRSAHAGHLVVRESPPARVQQLIVIVDPWPEPAEAVPAPSGELHARETGGGRGTKPAGRSPPESPVPAKPATKTASRLSRLRFGWLGRGSRPMHWPAESVERIISVAATASCEALERGHRVGLIVRAAIPVVIAPSGGRSHRQRLLHELALLKPAAGEGLDKLVSRVRWSGGWFGRCLVCATHTNRTHGQVVRFLAVRAEAAVAVTCDSENFDALFELSSDPRPEAAPLHRRVPNGDARP